MLVIIDNYDSFTYNLVHYLGELGATSRVFRNDQVTPDEVLALSPRAVVLSPGPCDPDRAGICLDLIAAAAAVRLPLLGVCLGHQAIGQAFGGRVVGAPEIMHGKVSAIHHQGTGVFADLPSPFEATRYHSLVVDPDRLPGELSVTAESAAGGDGPRIIMGLQHNTLPMHGVQFHPESIATAHGKRLLANFLAVAGINVMAAA